MASFYKKAVVWLGLNEEYPDTGVDDMAGRASWEDDMAGSQDEYGAGYEPQPGPQPQMAARTTSAGFATSGADPLKPAPLSPDRDSGTVRAVPLDEPVTHESSVSAAGSTSGGGGTVRAVPMAQTSKPEVVVPESFNNAQDVADVYKESMPVVVDLSSAERDLARRLIDFSAGLCYGLGGQMQKLSTDVYLLIPDGVEVSAADRSRHS